MAIHITPDARARARRAQAAARARRRRRARGGGVLMRRQHAHSGGSCAVRAHARQKVRQVRNRYYYINAQRTVNTITQLKHKNDTYAHDSWGDAFQHIRLLIKIIFLLILLYIAHRLMICAIVTAQFLKKQSYAAAVSWRQRKGSSFQCSPLLPRSIPLRASFAPE